MVFSFFGTLFAPLTKDLMPYARFTPLYGAAEISRYPFTQGLTIINGSGPDWNMIEPLWYGVVSFAAWGRSVHSGNHAPYAANHAALGLSRQRLLGLGASRYPYRRMRPLLYTKSSLY